MFRSVVRVALPLGIAVSLILTAGAAGASQAASTPGWRVTTTVPAGSTPPGLAATGLDDAWTAGTHCTDAGCDRNTLLVRRWTGKKWETIAVPKTYVNSSTELSVGAVAARSASSAWVMNETGTEASSSTAVLHWTGKKWGPVTTLPALIDAAVAPSPKDAWAFGATPAVTPYAAHYNGSKWSRVAFPVAGVSAASLSPAYIWVIGNPASTSTSSAPFAIMLFNGKTWRSTPLPGLGLTATDTAIATGITAANPKNGWADGMIVSTEGEAKPPLKPFLLHWNGTKWSVVKVPYTGLQATGAIANDNQGGVWMGATAPATASGGVRGYILHYRDGKWTKVTAPAQPGLLAQPYALAWIRGTKSVWGIAGQLPPAPTALEYRSVVLKYGP
jgi:hypothetical protein